MIMLILLSDLGIPIAFQAVVLLQQYKGQMLFPVEQDKKGTLSCNFFSFE
jgi:hypothetical protein